MTAEKVGKVIGLVLVIVCTLFLVSCGIKGIIWMWS